MNLPVSLHGVLREYACQPSGLIEEKFPKDISSGLCRMIIGNKPFGALMVLTISMDTLFKAPENEAIGNQSVFVF